ncbi:MAG TPA: bifunctional alpha,alpha-trehalose-phosphate synthase (UDP-forming)/trehalose-phosphatase, partial [Candidatus Kapabacteria bacterium]|nr:bifunctional alpha,alpha-trehalose-phosphate synthase (UDP-forming)/trehalose-phosphatase [Candidatus Kapabacteria bacterium]
SPSVQKEKTKLKRTIEHKKVVLSIDRLDYTKGILKRLQGYERFLKKHDEWREKVTLLLVVVPSRTDVERYQEMKRNIDEIVGNINGKFGTVDWTPIIYQFRSVSFDELIALYSSSDIALVTPLRDGMNLIAKEYVASRRDKRGVLILSEMAGAAQELGEAMTINPHHVEEIVEALEEALDIPADEQEKDMVIMQSRLKRYNIVRWADDFVKELQQFTEEQKGEWEDKLIGAYMKGQIAKDFHLARKRLLLLDYDGTLVPFTKFPYLAKPGEDLLALLRQLTKIPDTTVAIISGRDKKTLQQWFKSVDVHLVAEHGIWVKDGKKGWHMLKPFRNDWKEALLPIMRTYADRVPGSFVEEKEFSVAWHYRLANPELALDRAKELTATLVNMTANMEVQVLQGKKLVEVRSTGADKGSASLHFLGLQKYDFILAIGDDTTDEDLFKAMPEYAYTIKVGLGQSAATYIIDSSVDTRSILEQLTKE